MDFGKFQTRKDDFNEIYRDAGEPLPHRIPTPHGRSVLMMAFVDASHGAKKVTRHSHTGYVVFLKRAPVL